MDGGTNRCPVIVCLCGVWEAAGGRVKKGKHLSSGMFFL